MGRKLGSIYLVVATWAFLVLPTSPCQLLIAFGIDVHGELNRSQEVALRSESNGYPVGECHCEEGILKTAEVVDPCVDAEVVWTDADSALIDFGYNIVAAPLRIGQRGGRLCIHLRMCRHG